MLFGAAGGMVVAGFGYFLFSFVLPSSIVLATAFPAYLILRRLRTIPASVAGVAVICTSFLAHGLAWFWKGSGAIALVPRWASMEPMTFLILSHLLLAILLLHIQLIPFRAPTKETA